MPRGGARNRSGPALDPLSGRSEARGISLHALPPKGWTGRIPDFPLPSPVDREHDLWAWAWRTPQAAAWAKEHWRWPAVAMWVRTFAACETPEGTAAMLGQLHRFADQIGLTPAGLRENGWSIAEGTQATPTPRRAAASRSSTSRNRLTVVNSRP